MALGLASIFILDDFFNQPPGLSGILQIIFPVL